MSTPSPFKGTKERPLTGTLKLVSDAEGNLFTQSSNEMSPVEQTNIDFAYDVDGEILEVGDKVYILSDWTDTTKQPRYRDAFETLGIDIDMLVGDLEYSEASSANVPGLLMQKLQEQKSEAGEFYLTTNQRDALEAGGIVTSDILQPAQDPDGAPFYILTDINALAKKLSSVVEGLKKESDLDFVASGVIEWFTLQQDPEVKDLKLSMQNDPLFQKRLLQELKDDDIFLDLKDADDAAYFKNLLQERAAVFTEEALEGFPEEVIWAAVKVDPKPGYESVSELVVSYQLKKATGKFSKVELLQKIAKMYDAATKKLARFNTAIMHYAEAQEDIKMKYAIIDSLIEKQEIVKNYEDASKSFMVEPESPLGAKINFQEREPLKPKSFTDYLDNESSKTKGK